MRLLTFSIGIFISLLVAPIAVYSVTLPPCPVGSDIIYNSEFIKLLMDSYELKEYSDFSLAEQIEDPYICIKYISLDSETVEGNFAIISNNISELGLVYKIKLSVSIDKNNNVVELHPKLKKDEIKKLVKKFESKQEIKDFVSISANSSKYVFLTNVSTRLNYGRYFINYEFEDDFFVYSLPSFMSNKFPLLQTYKDKIRKEGCSVEDDTSILVYNNKKSKKTYILAAVTGTCKKNYDSGLNGVYRLDIPPKKGIIGSFKTWLSSLFGK